MNRRVVWLVVGSIMFLSLVVVYGMISPLNSEWFPKCVFLTITDLECPGCGSQRAVHSILNLELGEAWGFNPLVVVGLPYIVGGLALEIYASKRRKGGRDGGKKEKMWLKLREKMYGRWSMLIWGVGIVAFWVIRNL